MKLIYSVKQKGRLILLLSIFLGIEILSNSSQTENIEQLDTTISEIYADRLIAQDLIFKISENIHEQEATLMAENNPDAVVKLNQSFSEIEGLISSYDKTKLTKDEAIVLGEFKTKIAGLNTLASKTNNAGLYKIKDQYMAQLGSVSTDLNRLSEIQLSRSKDLTTGSHKIVSYSSIINELNWALMIITALAIAAIVLASKSIVSRFPQQQQLN